jgi:hypothetical protein
LPPDSLESVYNPHTSSHGLAGVEPTKLPLNALTSNQSNCNARSDAEQNRWALCGARPAEKGSNPVRPKGKCWAGVGGDMSKPPEWYNDNANNPPWIEALAEVRRLAPLEGWCYHHVQAIIVSIDQYAEAALGNREYFLNKPHGMGGGRNDHIP